MLKKTRDFGSEYICPLIAATSESSINRGRTPTSNQREVVTGTHSFHSDLPATCHTAQDLTSLPPSSPQDRSADLSTANGELLNICPRGVDCGCPSQHYSVDYQRRQPFLWRVSSRGSNDVVAWPRRSLRGASAVPTPTSWT